MMTYNFGEVVLVPFPFTDLFNKKKRPAVIISSNSYNAQYPDIIIMAITSQLKTSTQLGEVMITSWQNAGLLKPSMIKPVVATVEKGLILRKLGQLQSADSHELQEALKVIFS
ncbi:type II toxin-antitoxin system PemK/MazF family toxin [Laspinema palackyanum]|uniref:type II toxin-antitoxin system PemK/MazF family toxin n=1 Tax=Laspinema palackyanum TaxID=3231601 RepID=UPI00345D1442|nr:type II toxin-antitoxin system PemK/MazF family toxin [Laspinema sp. D2c]